MIVEDELIGQRLPHPHELFQPGPVLRIAGGQVQQFQGSFKSAPAEIRPALFLVIVEVAANNYVAYFCTCPYFKDNYEVCKHVWASLLAADRDELLPEHKRRVAPALTADDALEEDDDDLDDEEPCEPDEEEKEEDWAVDDTDDEEEPAVSHRRMSASERQRRAERMKAYWLQWRNRSKRGGRIAPVQAPASPPKPPPWKTHLQSLSFGVREPETTPEWSADKQIVYVLGGENNYSRGDLNITVEARQRKKDGAWRAPRVCRVRYQDIPALPDPADRRILQILIGTPRYTGYSDPMTCFYPSSAALVELLPLMCETGRCFRRDSESRFDDRQLSWDHGECWLFRIEVKRDESSYSLSGSLRRGEEHIPLSEPASLFENGFFVHRGQISRYDHDGAFQWIRFLHTERHIEIPIKDRDEFFAALLGLPSLPGLDLPEELRFEEIRTPGLPRLLIRRSKNSWERGALEAALQFVYSGFVVPSGDAARVIPDLPSRRRVLRDRCSERSACRRLEQLGFRQSYSPDGFNWNLSERDLPRAVQELAADGWQVEAQGKLFRTASAFNIEVVSGIDWFELRGRVRFGERSAPLPALLAALRRKENTVRLDDGSIGILPEEWLRKYGVLAGLGTAEQDHLRFKRCQTGLLDALLAAEPAATCDEVFERARERLRRFEGVAPAQAPEGFCGELREYQREGLGWIHFLREFGFGGCQADDMGLGKTIQVLEALLRLRQAAIHPGLIDQARSRETSAKLEALLPQLEEVLEEGHKALVFSQSTSMLAILKPRIEAKGIAYSYLDGKTADRKSEVERFQNDPDCRLFLISLKAGGLGLNLTAAEYVFLLDPWWNPAVEMQAIDRSHRLGQTRTVFAYRLIASNTVEEKVLELQRTKRDLADAIIRADNSLIRDLRPEDLALLLS